MSQEQLRILLLVMGIAALWLLVRLLRRGGKWGPIQIGRRVLWPDDEEYEPMLRWLHAQWPSERRTRRLRAQHKKPSVVLWATVVTVVLVLYVVSWGPTLYRYGREVW